MIISMIMTSLYMIVIYDNDIKTYDHQHDHDIIIRVIYSARLSSSVHNDVTLASESAVIVLYDDEIITYDHQHNHDIITHDRLL
jgi:hypothetical protein